MLADEMTVSQAANALFLSPSRVKQLADSGQLACKRTPLGRLFSREAVEALMAERGMVYRAALDVNGYTRAELIEWARERIKTESSDLVELALANGLADSAGDLRLGLRTEIGLGTIIAQNVRTGALYALAPGRAIVGQTADGTKQLWLDGRLVESPELDG